MSESANEAASEALRVLPPGASEWELGAGGGAGAEARGGGGGGGWKRQIVETQIKPTV